MYVDSLLLKFIGDEKQLTPVA